MLQSNAQLSYSVMRNHEIMVLADHRYNTDKEYTDKVRAKVAIKEDALLTWAGSPLASDPEERKKLIDAAMRLNPNFNK